MKVCVVSGIFHPEIGGPATHLLNLCLELLKRGNEIYVITYGDPKEAYNYPFHIKRVSRKPPLFLRLFNFLYQVIKIGRNCDIFYVEHYGLPVALANVFLHKPTLIRVPSDFAWEFAIRHKLVSCDILYFQKKNNSFKIRAIKAIQSFYCQKADFIIVSSKYMRNIAAGWIKSAGKIRVIHNAPGRNFTIDIPANEAKAVLGLKGRIITTAARLIPLKGIDGLIRVIKELDDDIKLLILGDGPEKERLKHLAKSIGVQGRVFFKGEIPRDKMALYLSASDIFVLNSETEDSPQVILEAMALGVSVIVAKVGAIPEIIEDEKEGLLIEQGNPIHLKAAILKLFKDEKFKTGIIKNAREKIRLFSFDRMVNETLELFKHLSVKREERNFFQKQWACFKKLLAGIVFYSGLLWLIKGLLNLLFKKERIVILAYHRVTEENDFIAKGMGGTNVTRENFESHIRYLKKNYSIVSLDNLAEFFNKGSALPRKSAIITFDDGYLDNYTDAFKILKSHNVPATIFLMTDFIGGGKIMWRHKNYYNACYKQAINSAEEKIIASKIYLNWQQVIEMSQAGISIGSHAASHQILSQLEERVVKDEIFNSKDKIERMLGRPVLHFAYPFGTKGSFTQSTKEILKQAGFQSACSMSEAINTANSDPYSLGRIGLGNCNLPVFASRLLLNEILTFLNRN